MKYIASLSLLALLFVSCGNEKNSEENKNTAEVKEVVFDGISPSIKPGDDFFQPRE